MDLSSLPNPSTTSMAEINFRRLLQNCHQHLQTDDSIRSQPRFHAYVAKLQELLSDLEASNSMDKMLLSAYRRFVRHISDQLEPLSKPAFCHPARVKDHLAGKHTASNYSPMAKSSRPADGIFTPTPMSPAAAQPGSEPPSTGFSVSNNTRQRLQLQDQLQEELTGDLLSMSAALKENVAGMHSAIEQRGKVLQQADVALEDSMANAKRSTARAKEQFQRGKGSFCLTLLLLLAVGGLFTAMLVYIKGTHLLGYRAGQVVAQARQYMGSREL